MIDLNKEYQTKKGEKVILYEIHKDKVIGMVTSENPVPFPTMWNLNGKHYLNAFNEYDLVEVFESKSIWVNVYYDGDNIYIGHKHSIEQLALEVSKNSTNYIKTIEITNKK
jgi:hypothetical protein